MWRNCDAEFLVQAPSEIEFRDGMFHVIERFSAECCVRKAYTPAIFVAAIAAANAALAKWQREQQESAVGIHIIHPVAKLTG